MKKHETVDQYLEAQELWQAELTRLRAILCSTGLDETIKWGSPVYTLDGKNVVGIGGFKSYFGLWFFQGALLADRKRVLINAQEGKTKALRQWRMQSAADIDRKRIEAYVKEAVGLARRGVTIEPQRAPATAVPAELNAALRTHPGAKSAFGKLTPGRRREYAEYVDSAKRAETRAQRVKKVLPLIAAGLGLNDKYRNC